MRLIKRGEWSRPTPPGSDDDLRSMVPISRRRARTLAILFFGIAVFVMAAMFALLNGCGAVKTKENGDVHLTGKAGEMFRALTGAGGMTINDRRAIYPTDAPSAYVVCHEGEHKRQAKILGDLLVKFGFIDDDELSRTKAWIDTYATDWIQRGYAGNRFERGAHEACRHLIGR